LKVNNGLTVRLPRAMLIMFTHTHTHTEPASDQHLRNGIRCFSQSSGISRILEHCASHHYVLMLMCRIVGSLLPSGHDVIGIEKTVLQPLCIASNITLSTVAVSLQNVIHFTSW